MPKRVSPCRPPTPPLGLLARLDAKIDRSGGPDACWPCVGAHSRSGGREVEYPHLQEGGIGSRHWRVNRLVLLLEELPEEAWDSERDLLRWLRLANLLHREEEAAHTCDNSRCGNPKHLAWQSHTRNVQEQAARRRVA